MDADVFLTPEEKEFRKEVKDFVDNEVMPKADEIERTDDFDLIKAIIKKMADQGYLGIAYPEKYGGTDRSMVETCIIVEELSRASEAVVATVVTGSWGAIPILRFGTEEQKQKWLPLLAKGEKLYAFALTEPEVGSDIARMKTTAELVGDEFVINGEKRFITNAGEADLYLTAAITGKDVAPHRGISMFIVEPNMPGFKVAEIYSLMGRRGGRNGWIVYNDVRVPKENLVGELNRGFYHLLNYLSHEHTIVAIEAVGIARAALEASLKRALEREQFGYPIGYYQAVRFKLADMAINVEAARLLAYQAARMLDVGKEPFVEAAMAKAYAAEIAMKVTTDAVQVWGGDGYRQAYPLERYMRDAKLMAIGGGTVEINKDMVIRGLYRQKFNVKIPRPTFPSK